MLFLILLLQFIHIWESIKIFSSLYSQAWWLISSDDSIFSNIISEQKIPTGDSQFMENWICPFLQHKSLSQCFRMKNKENVEVQLIWFKLMQLWGRINKLNWENICSRKTLESWSSPVSILEELSTLNFQ